MHTYTFVYTQVMRFALLNETSADKKLTDINEDEEDDQENDGPGAGGSDEDDDDDNGRNSPKDSLQLLFTA